MKKRIDFRNDEVEKMLKKYFKIKGTIIFWHIASVLDNGNCVEYVE